MEAIAPVPTPFTIQCVGGPVVDQLSFSLDRGVGIAARTIGGEPVPDRFEDTLRRAYADALVLDHGTFAGAWSTPADSERLFHEHDRFIKAVLATYPPQRIVLLRSAIRRFYWARNAVQPRRFPGDVRDITSLREFLERLDNRFVEATGCLLVEEAAAHLPTRDTVADDPQLGHGAILAVEDAVLAALRSGACTRPAGSSGAAEGFADQLREALLAGAVSVERIAAMLPADGLQTHDDVAALAAAAMADRDADWTPAASAALPQGGPIRALAEARFESNRDVLRDHPHLYVPGGLDFTRPERLVVRLHESWFLTLQPDQARKVTVRNYGRRDRFDVPAFCDGGYVCRPHQIESALESWESYFERGRRGDTMPFRIAFAGRGAFRESLEYLDYADILANENYCLTIDGQVPADLEWRGRVDLSFLFDPRTRVCMVAGGIGDQVYRYVDPRAIAERHGLRFFVDDLWFDYPEPRQRSAHGRPDLVEMMEAEGILSQILSRRLRQRRRSRRHDPKVRGEYADLGLVEQVLVVERGRLSILLRRDRDPQALVVVALTDSQLDRSIASPPPGVTFIDVIAKSRFVTGAGLRHKARWEHAIAWPEFVSEASADVAAQMMSTDAVVVHVRRGDRVALGVADADEYYRDFVERIAALEEYPDKHLFVFSDDLDYCRAHRHELGLDLLGDRVTFVEGNRHFASIDDFHLMSLGKVMVCGVSGFSATAAMVSDRVEYVFGDGYAADGGDMWHRSPAQR